MIEFNEIRSEEGMYRAIGRRVVQLIEGELEFAAAKKGGKGKGGANKKDCKKGISCGASCIAKTKACVKEMSASQKAKYNALLKKVKAGGGGGGEAQQQIDKMIADQVAAKTGQQPEPAPVPAATAKTAAEAPAKMPKAKATKAPATGMKLLTDQGEYLMKYKDSITSDGKPNKDYTSEFDSGRRNLNPIIYADGKAIGARSQEMAASLNASTNENARTWTISAPNDPDIIKSVKALESVPDKNPASVFRSEAEAREIRALPGKTAVGEMLNLWVDKISGIEGGHGGTKKQVSDAAKDLKKLKKSWVPVMVRQLPDGNYQVIGNHFVFDAVKASGIDRLQAVIVE